jgi:hypothetical protein
VGWKKYRGVIFPCPRWLSERNLVLGLYSRPPTRTRSKTLRERHRRSEIFRPRPCSSPPYPCSCQVKRGLGRPGLRALVRCKPLADARERLCRPSHDTKRRVEKSSTTPQDDMVANASTACCSVRAASSRVRPDVALCKDFQFGTRKSLPKGIIFLDKRISYASLT